MSDSSQMQPGWYYAQGDAPGTQRYWDGTQWVGAPQPVGGAVDGGGGAVMGAAGAPVEFGPRAMAWLVDTFPYFVVAFIANFFNGASDSGISLIGGFLGLLGVAYLLFNKGYKMGTTGQSIGKGMQNTKLVSDATGQPIGIGLAIARLFVSWLSLVLCLFPYILDHLWPLWDGEKKRLIDKIFKTSVVPA